MATRGIRVVNIWVIVIFALMTGFFFSFSVTVMPGLDVSPPNSAILAMQGINRAVRNGLFFATFILGLPLSVLLSVWMVFTGDRRGATKLILAAVIYGVGVILLTAQINVPMNNALAQVGGVIASPGQLWTDFSIRWTYWNTVRTVFCGIALLLAVSALQGKVQKRRELSPMR